MNRREMLAFTLVAPISARYLAQTAGPQLADYGKPAPKWLREAGMFNGWYAAWTDRMLDWVAGTPLIVTVQAKREIIDKLHQRGVRVANYVNAWAMYSAEGINREIKRRQQTGESIQEDWWAMRESPVNQSMDLTLHPEWVLMGPEGYPRNKPFTSEEIYHGNTVALQSCPNAVGYREALLATVKNLMEMGEDGVFMDCTESFETDPAQKRCYGPELGKHQHVHPDMTNAQVYLGLQKEIYGLVKSYGEERVVLLNSSWKPEYLRSADASMLESFILTSSRYRWQDWEELQKMRQGTDPALQAGKAVLALSYCGYTPNPIDDDAFYAYTCARLFGYAWADWFTLADARSTLLYRLNLGAPKSEILEYNGLLYRIFEEGVVVVNPYKGERELRIDTGHPAPLRDVLTNHRYARADLKENLMQGLHGQDMYKTWPVNLWVTIPGESGHVFITGYLGKAGPPR
jgi:hypothetical protein